MIGDDEIDRLYQLPLEEFVKARNDLAATLKKSGDADAASRVRGLSKPSPSAWAINQLYWTARPRLDDLIAASDRYRQAQRAALAGDGSELAGAERERQRAIEGAVRQVRFILAERDRAAGEAPEAMMRRVQTTLEALASYGSENANPFRGRLSEDLDAPGFGALSSLAPSDAPPAAARREKQALKKDEEALAAARATLSKAMARAELQAAALDQAQVALTRAAEEANRAAAEVDEAKARVAQLEEALRFRSSESGEAAG